MFGCIYSTFNISTMLCSERLDLLFSLSLSLHCDELILIITSHMKILSFALWLQFAHTSEQESKGQVYVTKSKGSSCFFNYSYESHVHHLVKQDTVSAQAHIHACMQKDLAPTSKVCTRFTEVWDGIANVLFLLYSDWKMRWAVRERTNNVSFLYVICETQRNIPSFQRTKPQ